MIQVIARGEATIVALLDKQETEYLQKAKLAYKLKIYLQKPNKAAFYEYSVSTKLTMGNFQTLTWIYSICLNNRAIFTNITSVSFQTAGNCRYISGTRLAGRNSAQFNLFTAP